MIKHVLLFSLILIVISVNKGYSQDNSNIPVGRNSISFTGFEGLKIFSAEKNYMNGNFWSLEAAYNLNMVNNNSDWVKMMGVKDIGFAFSYRNMDNVSLTNRPGTEGFIGDAYALTSRLDISLLEAGKIDFFLTPGFGFAYVTKSYRTNYNPLIGTHINFAAEIGLKMEAPITNSTKLRAGVHLFHFSNAAFKLPNDGVNTINATLGVIQDINLVEKPRKTYAYNFDDKGAFEFGLGIGHRGLLQIVKQKLSPADSLKQLSATSHLNNMGFYAGYNYRLNSLLSIKAATDIVYYFTTYDNENKLATSQEFGTSYDKFSVGTSLGTDIWLGRTVFEANYGYYFHFAYGQTPIHGYWTFGAKYYLTPWIAIEAKQYLHQTEAHYANFGLLFHLH